jgi:hypothetical protein
MGVNLNRCVYICDQQKMEQINSERFRELL